MRDKCAFAHARIYQLNPITLSKWQHQRHEAVHRNLITQDVLIVLVSRREKLSNHVSARAWHLRSVF